MKKALAMIGLLVSIAAIGFAVYKFLQEKGFLLRDDLDFDDDIYYEDMIFEDEATSVAESFNPDEIGVDDELETDEDVAKFIPIEVELTAEEVDNMANFNEQLDDLADKFLDKNAD